MSSFSQAGLCILYIVPPVRVRAAYVANSGPNKPAWRRLPGKLKQIVAEAPVQIVGWLPSRPESSANIGPIRTVAESHHIGRIEPENLTLLN